MRQRRLPRQETTMTPIALPAAVVRALRHPTPEAKDFTPTRFQPAESKSWFATHYLRFISSDCPRHQFTLRFYRQLMHCFGHIAHYDSLGFWTEFFTSTAGKIEFLEQTLAWPCYGRPDVTWSDVEGEIIARLRRTNLLDLYRQHLGIEQDAADRAELSRLMAKFGGDTPPADPGIMRTVLIPMNRSAPTRTSSRQDGDSQLTLGLG